MKFNVKKYIFLLNDVTNLLLGKEKQMQEEQIRKLRTEAVFLCIILIASLFINLYFVLFK